MQDLRPFENWKNHYDAAKDVHSPFFGRHYSDSVCRNTLYNYYIHPEWDEIGSETLYIKILFADYQQRFCIIELMGEWNDCLNNDIMFLKRKIADTFIANGINKFVLIAENVLNFHASESDYYQEWSEDTEDGWIALINCRHHVLDELRNAHANWYLAMGGHLNMLTWRAMRPGQLVGLIEKTMNRRIGTSR